MCSVTDGKFLLVNERLSLVLFVMAASDDVLLSFSGVHDFVY